MGDRFVVALETAYRHIQEYPIYQLRKGIYRYAQIEGFPRYRIVYVVDDATVFVYQVCHTSRRPSKKFGP